MNGLLIVTMFTIGLLGSFTEIIQKKSYRLLQITMI